MSTEENNEAKEIGEFALIRDNPMGPPKVVTTDVRHTDQLVPIRNKKRKIPKNAKEFGEFVHIYKVYEIDGQHHGYLVETKAT